MTRPGTRLRALAARVCSERTMERLIDPVIADLQAEHAEAAREGRAWRSGWALVVGYVALGKVLLLCGLVGMQQLRRDWDHDDRHNLSRVLWRAGLTTLAFTCLLEIPGMMQLPAMQRSSPGARTSLLIAYLVPAGLATSIPIGMLIGVTLGLAGRPRSRRLPAAVLLVGLGISAVSLVNLAWIVPAANQSYREELSGGTVPKGERELTLIEMRRAAEELRRWDDLYPSRDRLRRLTFAYHQRYAIAGAPLTFALLALFIAPRRRLRWTAAVVLCCAVAVSIVYVSRLGLLLGQVDWVSPAIGAWLPQIVATTAIVLVAILSRSKEQHVTPTRV